MTTRAVGTIVSVCADQRKTLLSTVEFRWTGRSLEIVFWTCRMTRTTATQHTATAALLTNRRRLGFESRARYHTTRGTRGNSVMALLFDRRSSTKHTAPPIQIGRAHV